MENLSSARQGFTLVELLLTLFLISLLLVFSLQIPYQRIEETTTNRLFVSELDKHIKFAQEVSILQQVKVDIHFDPISNHIVFYSVSSDINQTILSLPMGWYLPQEVMITYLPNGHIRQFRRVVLLHENLQTQLSLNFQLGSGRYVLNYSE
ncbi:prepilin-type N-terminal cleavage/methylation domain-containing protein [Aerococcaceae bacterium DSM 111020]|nr:prepilin-type N-terminal cleavage/methylation domain-containing protein [Aerococcaceae bacterium DSM 111020]